MCVHMCMGVHMCVYRDKRSVLDIFLDYFPTYCLRQDLVLNLLITKLSSNSLVKSNDHLSSKYTHTHTHVIDAYGHV